MALHRHAGGQCWSQRHRCPSCQWCALLQQAYVGMRNPPPFLSLPQEPELICSSVNDLGQTISVSCGTWSTWWKQASCLLDCPVEGQHPGCHWGSQPACLLCRPHCGCTPDGGVPLQARPNHGKGG